MRIQQLTKKFKKNQSGRSMVEMLGVLAIIGVLSVGGVAGYRYAMEKITLNRALSVIEQFVLSVQMENKRGVETPYDLKKGEKRDKEAALYFCQNYLGGSDERCVIGPYNTIKDKGLNLEYSLLKTADYRDQVCISFWNFPKSQVHDLVTLVASAYGDYLSDFPKFMTDYTYECDVDPDCVYEYYTNPNTGICFDWIPLENESL